MKTGELEVAPNQIAEFQVKFNPSDLDPVIALLEEDFGQRVSKEQFRSAKRFNRIITSLRSLQRHGLDASYILDPVILPEG